MQISFAFGRSWRVLSISLSLSRCTELTIFGGDVLLLLFAFAVLRVSPNSHRVVCRSLGGWVRFLSTQLEIVHTDSTCYKEREMQLIKDSL
jgi:hypothetical protein